jgi:uncharacterized membrane protein
MENKNKEGAKETSRVEAFTDGVFAIAITLLILDLIQSIKPEGNKELLTQLVDHSNAFLAFAIGFLTILICWINHHLVFTYINKTDSNLMWVNGFVLLMVTLTPLAAAILSEYFAKERHVAMAIFGFNFFMMALAAYCLSAYVYRRQLIREDDRELFKRFISIYRYSIVYTFLVFFVCLLSVAVAIFFYFILFIVFAYPKEFAERLYKRKHRKN